MTTRHGPVGRGVVVRPVPVCPVRTKINQKRTGEKVARNLARYGFSVGILSGDVRQQKRTRILDDFTKGKLHLLVATEHILRRHPAGINELGLIKTLQEPPWELIGEVNFGEPDKLYPVHFLLFHVLYRLRDQLATGLVVAQLDGQQPLQGCRING